MAAYYNEFDPGAAAWLRELISGGHIAAGEVDERSILEVHPDDLRGFTQCHFFAGIGGWSYALRLAGVPDNFEVWTGSPPCQPFSTAGPQKGKEDDRHLAPHFAELVAAGRPQLLFGEQVASAAILGKIGKKAKRAPDGTPEWAWIDDLFDRLEGSHYACGAADIPAASVRAPHIRQRTFFGAVRLADAVCSGQPGPGVLGRSGDPASEGDREVDRVVDAGGCRGLANTDGYGSQEGQRNDTPAGHGASAYTARSVVGMADACGAQCEADGISGGVQSANDPAGDHGAHGWAGADHGQWRDIDWLYCRDGKWRAVESGTFPLAHGIPARVGRLRGYGNAIVPQAAAEFVIAFAEALR